MVGVKEAHCISTDPLFHQSWGRKWNSIVSVSDHCLVIYFTVNRIHSRFGLWYFY